MSLATRIQALAVAVATEIKSIRTTAGSIASLPPGSYVRVDKAGGVWPARPTTRTDIVVVFRGADPDPATVVPPSVAGMYSGDERLVF